MSKKKRRKRKDWGAIIQYTSTAVMFLIVAVWIIALIYAAIIVWREPTTLDSFTTLASIVTGTAVIGYFGRIALTHWQTLKKTGRPVPNDFSVDEIINEEVQEAELDT